jgi:hypothetical protein
MIAKQTVRRRTQHSDIARRASGKSSHYNVVTIPAKINQSALPIFEKVARDCEDREREREG